MATVLIGPSEDKASWREPSLTRPVSRAAFAAGFIYLIGSLTDLGILWLGQRQPGVQWEFVAITNTVEAWPRMVLAVAFLYLAMHIGGSTSTAVYRILALCLLGLGIAAVALGGLMVLNYIQVSGNLEGDAASLVRTSVLKTELLCVLYAVLLIPIGGKGLAGLGRK